MNEMKREKACGCIVIDNDKVLLVQQNQGHWGFPKGHVEGNESEIETAIREVKEETNIDVIPNESKRYTEEYVIGLDILKQVVFFLAKKVSSNIVAQECEIKNVKWFTFEEAFSIITYENTKKLLKQVLKENGYEGFND